MEMSLLMSFSHPTLSDSLAVSAAVESKVTWPRCIRAEPEHKQTNCWEGQGKLAETVGVHSALTLASQTGYNLVRVFFLGNIYPCHTDHI